MPDPAPVELRVELFQAWLRQHRGITERTIVRHGRMIARLQIALGTDPAGYTAASIRQVVLDELRGTSVAYVKTMTTALRGYLRFLGASGACHLELMHAVPTVPQWRLSAMPRYLPVADVERMIASCEVSKPHGIRDKAILLLLARLGLRAGDVLNLGLGDICWAEGTLRVSGKGRREVCLPLPQDAGDAVLAYICNARPGLLIRATKFQKSRLLPLHDTVRAALDRHLQRRVGMTPFGDRLFTSTSHKPLSYNTASGTFRRLARSIGLRDGPGRPGTRIHDLRHTFAVRSLEGCAPERRAIARHLVALSTYLGHARVADTYWYLEATPVLLHEVATAGEILLRGAMA